MSDIETQKVGTFSIRPCVSTPGGTPLVRVSLPEALDGFVLAIWHAREFAQAILRVADEAEAAAAKGKA